MSQFTLMQMALHLRMEHGWGYRRIARRLGITEGRVRQWLAGETT